ncbi:MAG: hypothetical protein WCC03_20745 [Candidatus Acidiferrales bacterium]
MKDCVGLCTAGLWPALSDFAVDAKGKVKGARGTKGTVASSCWAAFGHGMPCPY